MYKEFATILDGKDIYGFLLYDMEQKKLKGKVDIETSLVKDGGIVNMNTARILAVQQEIDSLGTRDGQLVPIARDELIPAGTPKRFARKIKQWQENMTMEQFINRDCLFQKKDVDTMMADRTVILASVCQIMEQTVKKTPVISLGVAFYSAYVYGANRLRGYLQDYDLYNGKNDYGLFMVQFATLTDLLKFHIQCPLKFIYNMDTFPTMRSRMEDTASICPFPLGTILKRGLPKYETIEDARASLEEVNRITRTLLKSEERKKNA